MSDDDEGYVTPTLSTGDPSTLGNWRRLAAAFFGEETPQVAFLDAKIEESPNGPDEPVLANEGQLILMLANL